MEVKELEEKELLELIANHPKVMVKVWMDDCSNCVEYAPIFKKVAEETHPDLGFEFASFYLPAKSDGKSEFKKKYMKPDASGKVGAPGTKIFINGKLAISHYGVLSEENLRNGLVPIEQKLANLYTKKGQIMSLYEDLPGIDKAIRELRSVLEN